MENTMLDWNEKVTIELPLGIDLNIALLVGRVEEQPELKYMPGSSAPVARFVLLTTEHRKNLKDERVNENLKHHIVVLGVEAENCRDCLKPGDRVKVEGRMKPKFIDQVGQVKRFVFDVISYDVEKLG